MGLLICKNVVRIELGAGGVNCTVGRNCGAGRKDRGVRKWRQSNREALHKDRDAEELGGNVRTALAVGILRSGKLAQLGAQV